MLKRCVILIACIVTVGCNRNKTVWDGVYTEAQAARGREVYNSSCVGCHTGDLKQLTGLRFIDDWREESLMFLFDGIKTTMPADAPSSLSNQQYVDVLTFILKKNGFPNGRKELDTDSLQTFQMVGRDGPQPLPDSALVQVVGCLTKASETSWKLTNASSLVRTRSRFRDLTRDEMKIFLDQRRGRQSVDLSTRRFIPFLSHISELSSLVNHEVVTAGTLVRKQSDIHIEIWRVQEIDRNCTN